MNLKNYLNVLYSDKFKKNYMMHNINGDIMLFMCLQIFFARVVDVTLGTLRTILIVRGRKNSASIIAFFEVLIWFLIAKEALDNIDESILVPICYAAGFAVGTYIGIRITNRFIDSFVTAQVTIKRGNEKLINTLRKNGFGVSVVALKKENDNIKKDILFIAINKKSINELKDIVYKYDKNAFFIFNEVKYIQNGIVK